MENLGTAAVSGFLIPKYQRKALQEKIKKDIREILKKLCEYEKAEILGGVFCSDHVPICVKNTATTERSEVCGVSEIGKAHG